MPMKRIAFIALIALALLVAPLTVQAQTPEPSSPPRTAYGPTGPAGGVGLSNDHAVAAPGGAG